LAQTIVSEEREPKKNRYRTDSLELETVVRNMRMAFYGGDVKTWSQCSSEYSLRPILLDPFCPESFARLSPEIRALFFEMFSQDLVTQLEEPTAGFRDFVASYVDTLDDSLGGRGERAIVAAIDLFAAQGNLQALRGLGQRLTKPRSEISGCIAFLTGQYATAREQFEQAIKEARGRTKKRRIELRHVPSLFYGALLLKDNTPQSRKTLKELCRTIDDWETPYWVFAEPLLAAHKQQSKPLESQLPRNYEPDFFPPLGCWTAGLVWCWQISDSRAPFAIGHFKQLRDRYRASGLEWLAAEASAILARARDSNDDAAQDNFSRETHAKLGTVSIVELIQPLPAWENGLVALENLCVGDSPAGSVDETTADVGNERIIWQLDYSKSGSWLSPHPYLQKLGKKGWSKGRRDRDWFAASGKLSVDAELTLDMMNLLELVADSPSRFVRLDDGRILALTAELQKRIGDIVALGNPLKKKIRFSPVQALAFETALEGTVAKTDKHWKEHVGRIEEAATIDVQPPSTLQTELRDYQAEGYAWLKRLAHWNTGACLADDMGLGKTIQALALLVDRVWDGPALVVAPASVGFNWESETRKFAPTLTPNLLPPIFFLQFSCPHFPAPKRVNEYRSLPSNPEHRVFDGVDQSFQVGREDVTDGTNAKRIDSGDLAWVDHESLSFQQIVKSLEFVDVAAGIAKSSDDGTMQFARENGLESEAVHAIHQDAVVFGITGEAGGDTTFLLQLGHGLCESADDVGGAGETPFAPTVLHRSPLPVKIE
jgi:hypothetical protein